MADEQYILKKREIFAVGEHNGDTYTLKDLKDMVKNFKAMDFKPAIKMGHYQDDNQSYGYVDSVSISGNKIVATLSFIEKETYDAIVDKKYNRVSAEVYFNFKRNGKVYNKVIGALALLGHEIPGVAGLAPLYEIKDTDFETMSSYDFDIIENTVHTNSDGDSDAGIGNNNGDDNMSTEELKLLKQQNADLQTKVDKLVFDADSNGDTAKEYETKLKASNDELEKLKLKMLSKEADDLSNTLIIPAMRNQFKALYEHALSNDETKVKIYSAESKKDEELSLTEVLDSMVKYFNDKAKVIFNEYAESNNDRSEGYDDPIAEADKRIKKYMADNNTDDYSAAQKAVFAADSELKTAYAQI